MTEPEPAAETEPATETIRTHRSKSSASTAGAALLGVAVGGVFSIVGVLITNHAFDQRTQRDFLHQQRQIAFTTMLGDEHDASAEELTVSIAVGPNGAGFGSVAQTYSNMVTKLSTDAAEIRLVADDQAYALAQKVAGDHSQILLYYIHVAQCHDSKTPDCPAQAEVNQDTQQLTTDTQALIEAGRRAIGAR